MARSQAYEWTNLASTSTGSNRQTSDPVAASAVVIPLWIFLSVGKEQYHTTCKHHSNAVRVAEEIASSPQLGGY